MSENLFGWTQTFNRLGNLPLESNKIWDNLTAAQLYIDENPTAVKGDILMVIGDSDVNDGVYQIKSVGVGGTPGVLEKIGSSAEIANILSDIEDINDILPTLATKTEVNTGLSSKQNTLVSGTNIKSVNGNSLVGSGNVELSANDVDAIPSSTLSTLATKTEVNAKQNTLVSGTNIKTVNGQTLLGSGNITIESGSGGGAVNSVNGQVGTVVLDADDVSAIPSSTLSTLATKTELNTKQNTLVSGTNIKTVNSNSLIGSGNIVLDAADVGAIPSATLSTLATKSEVSTGLGDKQDTLVSSTNIKTINGQSLLGSGNITIESGGGSGSETVMSVNGQVGTVVLDATDVNAISQTVLPTLATKTEVNAKQNTLVSGSNIKTVNNQSIVGSGNVSITFDNAVDSVNGQTGVVVLDAADVSAIPSSTLPTLATKTEVNAKQNTLVSGSNIKTVNNQSIVGSGNVSITFDNAVDSVNGQTGIVVLDAADVGAATVAQVNAKQDTLVSGTNIKTINGTSILGSGNVVIEGSASTVEDFTNLLLPGAYSPSDYVVVHEYAKPELIVEGNTFNVCVYFDAASTLTELEIQELRAGAPITTLVREPGNDYISGLWTVPAGLDTNNPLSFYGTGGGSLNASNWKGSMLTISTVAPPFYTDAPEVLEEKVNSLEYIKDHLIDEESDSELLILNNLLGVNNQTTVSKSTIDGGISGKDDGIVFFAGTNAYNQSLDFLSGESAESPDFLVSSEGDVYSSYFRSNNLTINKLGLFQNPSGTYSTSIASSLNLITEETSPEDLSNFGISGSQVVAFDSGYSNQFSSGKIDTVLGEFTCEIPRSVGIGIAKTDTADKLYIDVYSKKIVQLAPQIPATNIYTLIHRQPVLSVSSGYQIFQVLHTNDTDRLAYRINISGTSKISQTGAAFTVNFENIYLSQISGNLIFSDAQVQVSLGGGYHAIRGGKVFTNDTGNIIYHPNGIVETWGTSLISGITSTSGDTDRYISLPVTYDESSVNISITQASGGSVGGAVSKIAGSRIMDDQIHLILENPFTTTSIYWKVLGRLA